MEEQIIKEAKELKCIADNFNGLSAYEQYISKESNKKAFNNILKECLRFAKEGCYSIGTFCTFRYDDPSKEFYKKYFKDLGYEIEMIDRRAVEEHICDYEKSPYRWYYVKISWK